MNPLTALLVILVGVVLLVTLVVGIRDRRARRDDWSGHRDRCRSFRPRTRERCVRRSGHPGPHVGGGWRARRWD